MPTLEYLGVHIDRQKNDRNVPVFSAEDSRVTLMTVPANEERVIAQHTYEMLAQGVEKMRVKGNRSPVQ